MSKIANILSVLSFVSVLVLLGLHFSKNKSANPALATSTHADGPNRGRIAYVNIDSFEASYDFLKTKKSEFEKKQKAIEEELARSEKQINSEASSLQKKAQAGSLTQSEGEAAQKRLMQMGQALEQKRQRYTEELYNEQNIFNESLRKELEDFLKTYNKDKGFDYILSLAPGSNILWADSAFNITKDVIKGMNERKTSSDEVKPVDTTK